MYPSLAPARYEDRLVDGLEHVSQVKNVARGLVARGYSDADIQKILGANLLDLYRNVWRP
jgi:membrane dipeptidase